MAQRFWLIPCLRFRLTRSKEKAFQIDHMAACLLYDITGFAKLNEKTLKKEGADFECI